MTVTQGDIDSFHDFATNLLSHTKRDFSLDEVVNQWRSEQDRAETA
jgi:hypothetical protein